MSNVLCTICVDSFTSDCIPVALECGHVFHKLCVDYWFQSSRTCPECRRCHEHTRPLPMFLKIADTDVASAEKLQAQKQMYEARIREMKNAHKKAQADRFSEICRLRISNEELSKKNLELMTASTAFENEPEQANNCHQLLEIEKMLLKYDLDIRQSLQSSAANPAKCLRVLEKYKSLSVTALMLKKNPSTVETVIRLRHYVGNVKDWNFDESQRSEFEEKAIKIRELAKVIYKNFRNLFNCSSADRFWPCFSKEVELFKRDREANNV